MATEGSIFTYKSSPTSLSVGVLCISPSPAHVHVLLCFSPQRAHEPLESAGVWYSYGGDPLALIVILVDIAVGNSFELPRLFHPDFTLLFPMRTILQENESSTCVTRAGTCFYPRKAPKRRSMSSRRNAA